MFWNKSFCHRGPGIFEVLGDFKALNTFSPKILVAIILSLCYTILLMLVRRL